MAKLKILIEGEEALRKKCREVTEITPRILTLLDDMVETMRDAGGVGLAAPQVGILRRIVVIEVNEGEVLELINPKIIESSGEQNGIEGCLSVPGRRATVARPEKVRVHAQDRRGRHIEVEGEALLARALCHELDHLDGILYVDKMIEDVTDREEEEEQEEGA